MLAGAFFFSLMSLLVKLVGQRVPSQEVVLVRGVLTAAISWVMLRRAGVAPWGTRPPVLLLRGLSGFGALSCLYYAVVHLPLADAAVLQFTNPVWALLLSAWLLRERFTRLEGALTLLGLGGVILVARPSFLFGESAVALSLFAVGIALLGAIFNATSAVMIRKLARTEHALVIVFYFALVTVPASIPGAFADPVWPTAREWILLLGVAVTAQVGQVYHTLGLQREPAGRATAVGYIQIVLAAIWGATFFGEIPTVWTVAGAGLILGSTLLIALARNVPVMGLGVPEEAVVDAVETQKGEA